MKKFIAIYSLPAAALAAMGRPTPEELQAETEKWLAWGRKNGDAILDLGAPLGRTKRITATGMSDTKNELTGYSLVQGESLDAVAAMFVGHPHFGIAEGGTIDIMECIPVPGM